jgi:Beta propeller domain
MTSRRVLRLPLIALSLAAIAPGCMNEEAAPYAPEAIDRAVLVHFQSCDDLLDYAHYRALDQVGPYGFDGEYGWDAGGEDGAAGESGGDDGGGEPAPNDGGGEQGGGTPDYSGTNVQEVGVDEPDIVKTDGTRILALAQGSLHYVDVQSGAPALVSSVPVLAADSEYYGYDAGEMLVHGNRVLLSVSRGAGDLPVEIREAFGLTEEDYMPVVQLVEIDVSNPAAMKVVSSLYIEGAYVSGRLHDHTARVVLSSQVENLQFKYPWDFLDENDIVIDEWSGGWDELAYAKAEAEAESYNRRIVLDTDIDAWVPSYVFEPAGQELQRGQLVGCQRMMRPGTHAGLGTLSVLTIDMAKALGLGDAVGIFSEGQTVYASSENLYVATRPFMEETAEGPMLAAADPEFEFNSYVHKFDITSEDAAHYQASGKVPGYLLSQWAMSEHEGDLRVASTDWGWGDSSESYVSVLRQKGERLDLVGQVAGLGKGEQIYAVRFIADVGYVVTFRQTDPLYTIDLTTPEAPAMVGELKINGYSAYLHPVGEGLLLGVGQDGTDDGQLLGTQVSLFDVSDPANPAVLSQHALGEWGSSEVEFDHHAFLYWGPSQLAVFPVQTWAWDEETGEDMSFTGAVAYRIDAENGIELVGTIEHDQAALDPDIWYGSNIRRSMVIGDQLFTMSNEGVQRNALADLVGDGWVEF